MRAQCDGCYAIIDDNRYSFFSFHVLCEPCLDDFFAHNNIVFDSYSFNKATTNREL